MNKYCMMFKQIKTVIFFLFCVVLGASLFAQSPCDDNGIHPFCTDQNPYGISYASGTTGDADAFFGSSRVACLSSVPCPAFYYFRVSQAGNMLIHIIQTGTSGASQDVDFACWGPFQANSQIEFVANLCNGTYNLNISSNLSTHRPENGYHDPNDPTTWGGYPDGNLVDCSYSAQGTEWVFIPNARVGEYYLLVLTNYSQDPGTIQFNTVAGSTTAATDCTLLAPVSNNGPICEGETLELTCANSQPGATYSWVGPNGFTANTQNVTIPNATPQHAGTYTLTMYYNGETDVETTTVIVHPPASLQLSSPSEHEPFCLGDETTITANGAATYLWDDGQTDATITVAPTTSTTYHVVGTDANGCTAEATYTLSPGAAEGVALPDQICSGETVSLATSSPEGTIFQWSTGDVGPTITPIVDQQTQVSLLITDPSGCMAESSMIVNPSPQAGFSPINLEVELVDDAYEIVFIDLSTGADSWFWDFGEGTDWSTSTLPSPSYTYTMSGHFYVSQLVSNVHGCRDSIVGRISVKHPFSFYAPNAFTPYRDDGLNDVFQPKGSGIMERGYEMTIFNQWGNIVYQTTELLGSWDGRNWSTGAVVPLGVYVYRVKLLDFEEEEKVFYGTVTLIR